jgi:Kef-type K+ transport system membrane component KefB
MAAEYLFISILIILVSARVLGELFQRAKMPPLVGELLAGVLIGPSLLGIVLPSSEFDVLSSLAVFFMMLLAGLEMDSRQIRRAGKPALVVSIIAFMLPLLSGYYVSQLFGLSQIQSWFMALLLSITAVPVSAMVMMQLEVLNTKLGNTVMAAAVMNDIMALIVLSVLLQGAATNSALLDQPSGSSLIELAVFIIGIGVFLGEIFLFDILFTSSRTMGWLPERIEPFFRVLHTREASFAVVLITTIALSLLAQEIGLHFIIGTFFAGLVVYKQIIGKGNFDRVYGVVSAITFGFFGPIFFGLIGISFNAQTLANSIPLFLALLAVAISTKIGGGFIGARISGFSKQASLTLGSLMNGRGMVELAIASVGFSAGIIDSHLFSVAVAIGFVTTIVAPISSRTLLARAKKGGSTEFNSSLPERGNAQIGSINDEET